MPTPKESERGCFITLEGIEGVGKSTLVPFITQWLIAHNIEVTVTREPGGTPIAEEIRAILLSHRHQKMVADTELLLLFASRAQHIAEVIQPALDVGRWVVCDRFTDATFAYQGGGRGIDQKRIALLANLVQGPLQPQLTLLLDAPPEVGFDRMRDRKQMDRFEQEKLDFFHRVRNAYLELAHTHPERIKIIDATQPIEVVQQQIIEQLNKIVAQAAHAHV